MNEWIPVSKRLPDEDERIKSYDRTEHASEFIVMIEGATNPTTLYLTMDNYWKDENGYFYTVIAWMSLPEPYKGQGMSVGEIGYSECADVLLKLWMDNILTDAEYNRIMNKLNKAEGQKHVDTTNQEEMA